MNVKQILGFGPKDDTITTIFYNDLVLSVYPDGDIKKLWHGQIIPDEHDLHMQLERAGLKTLEVAQEHSKTNVNRLYLKYHRHFICRSPMQRDLALIEVGESKLRTCI